MKQRHRKIINETRQRLINNDVNFIENETGRFLINKIVYNGGSQIWYDHNTKTRGKGFDALLQYMSNPHAPRLMIRTPNPHIR
jgi:hypothetical protein